jgi:hypothetical protein
MENENYPQALIPGNLKIICKVSGGWKNIEGG